MHALERVVGDEREAVIALARDGDVPRVPALDLDLAQVVQVLVVDLQAMALAVDDVHVFLRIKRELVRQHPLAGTIAFVVGTALALAHLLDELAGLVEHRDAVVAVAVGDDDVAVLEHGHA